MGVSSVFTYTGSLSEYVELHPDLRPVYPRCLWLVRVLTRCGRAGCVLLVVRVVFCVDTGELVFSVSAQGCYLMFLGDGKQ